jgi:hypothetical protein
MSILTTPLESIIIDDRDEETIVEEARLRVYNQSGGLLNDFSENSIVSALIQGQSFAASELLYKTNKSILSFVIDFLKVTGVERRLGNKAVVDLTFTLTTALNTTFTLPIGYEVIDDSNQYVFVTTNTLQIPPGLTQGTVSAEAEEVGTKYNLAAYSLNKLTQPITYLNSVINSFAPDGGTDEETIDQTIDRALVELRTKNLVSKDDYENAAESILGQGSVAIAVGLLAANKVDEKLGAVHLFLLGTNKSPANITQINLVKNTLLPRIQLGTSLYVSPMEMLDVNCEVVARLISDEEPDIVADKLWEAYQNYLDPSTYPIDKDIIINEIEFALRITGLIEDIQYINLNDNSLNIALPLYTLPNPNSLYIQLTNSEGNVYSILRGAGEVDVP